MAAAHVTSGTPLSPGVIAAIRRMASHPAWSGKTVLAELAATLDDPVLNPGEAWSDAALADAASHGQAWWDLLGHAVTAVSAKPSARWEKTARGLLAAVGERAAAERISAWLALVGQSRTIPLIGRGRGTDPRGGGRSAESRPPSPEGLTMRVFSALLDTCVLVPSRARDIPFAVIDAR